MLVFLEAFLQERELAVEGGIVIPVLVEATAPASDSAEIVGDGSLGLQL